MEETAKEFLLEWWSWIKDASNNRGVMLIVAAAGVLVTMTGILVKRRSPVPVSPTPPPPGGEVWQSVEDFQTALERHERNVEKRLAQAHGDERTRMENELQEVKRQLSDIKTAYADRQKNIRELETELARLSEDIGDDRLAEIRAAMEAGDFSKADALLAEIENRANAAIVQAAEAAFQRGKIAVFAIRWNEAATHFDKAARLDPTYDHLNEAGELAHHVSRYKTALRHFEELLEISRHEHGEKSPKTATVINNLAASLRATGRYDEAEPLFRQALKVARETLGKRHPNYALWLNNLANLLRETKRYDEAEPLFKRAREISRETLGEKHPDYASVLSNLAALFESTGRYNEAEPLYWQALDIFRTTLGDTYPKTKQVAGNYARFLRMQFPGNPALDELKVRFGEDVGRN